MACSFSADSGEGPQYSIFSDEKGGIVCETCRKTYAGSREHSSAIWREMMARASDIIYHMRWVIGDGKLINFKNDPWISDVPLTQWLTFISMDVTDIMTVDDLLTPDGTQ